MLRIKLYNYSDYNSDTCNNGGNYAFFTTYTECKNGKFRVEYTTTADFPYCPFCGTFGDCWCKDYKDPWTYVSKEEAMEAYNYANNINTNEDYYGVIEEITEDE